MKCTENGTYLVIRSTCKEKLCDRKGKTMEKLTLTSAEAAKLLRKLNDEYASIAEKEEKRKVFRAALGEDPESVRPAYDYRQTQTELEETAEKIRRVKHAVNLFNVSTVVPGFDVTVDEMLVLIPQLTRQKAKLAGMRLRLPKERVDERLMRGSNVIDYTYLNYDPAEAQSDHAAVSDRLAAAQLALDRVNQTVTFQVEI